MRTHKEFSQSRNVGPVEAKNTRRALTRTPALAKCGLSATEGKTEWSLAEMVSVNAEQLHVH